MTNMYGVADYVNPLDYAVADIANPKFFREIKRAGCPQPQRGMYYLRRSYEQCPVVSDRAGAYWPPNSIDIASLKMDVPTSRARIHDKIAITSCDRRLLTLILVSGVRNVGR